jgi:hypothetical protein
LAQRGGTPKSFGPPDYPACAKLKRAATSDTAADIHRQCSYEWEAARAQAVSTLVRAEQLKREARRRGIDPTRAVARALAELNRQSRARLPRARPIKAPTIDFANGVLRDRVVAALPLTEAEIQGHARANAEVFLTSESRRAHILQASTELEADKARHELDRTASWTAVQDRYGVKPFNLHWTGTQVVKESLAPHDAFGRSLFATRPHRLLGPIRTLNGYFLFEVIDIRPAPKPLLTSQAHTNVAAYLRQQRLEQVLYDHYAKITTCSPKYLSRQFSCMQVPAGATPPAQAHQN